jgi:hypothetical protein
VEVNFTMRSAAASYGPSFLGRNCIAPRIRESSLQGSKFAQIQFLMHALTGHASSAI